MARTSKQNIDTQIKLESHYDESHNLLWTVTSDEYRKEYYLYKGQGLEYINKATTPIELYKIMSKG